MRRLSNIARRVDVVGSACVDIRPSLKTDVRVYDFIKGHRLQKFTSSWDIWHTFCMYVCVLFLVNKRASSSVQINNSYICILIWRKGRSLQVS